MPNISVVVAVPVYNRREVTLAGLRSLLAADRTGLDLHVVVVDDGSIDGTGQAIRSEFPEIEVVDGDGTLNYSKGTNLAIEAGLRRSPRYVVALNDDSEFDPGFLTALVRCAEAHPRSVVGALLTQQGRPGYAFQVGQQWSTWFGGWRVPQDLRIGDLPDRAFRVECIVGNCVLVPAAAIREVGLQDGDRFPHGFGDAEWTMRLRRAGWDLLVEPSGARSLRTQHLPAGPARPRREAGASDPLRRLDASTQSRSDLDPAVVDGPDPPSGCRGVRGLPGSAGREGCRHRIVASLAGSSTRLFPGLTSSEEPLGVGARPSQEAVHDLGLGEDRRRWHGGDASVAETGQVRPDRGRLGTAEGRQRILDADHLEVETSPSRCSGAPRGRDPRCRC